MSKYLVVFCLLALSPVFAEQTADESHGWAVVYNKSVVDPTCSYAMYWPEHLECNNVYKNEEHTMWFASREHALDFVNGFWLEGPMGGPIMHITGSGEPYHPAPMEADRIVGIFECKRLPIHLTKIGTHKVTVQEPKEVETDIQEWKP